MTVLPTCSYAQVPEGAFLLPVLPACAVLQVCGVREKTGSAHWPGPGTRCPHTPGITESDHTTISALPKKGQPTARTELFLHGCRVLAGQEELFLDAGHLVSNSVGSSLHPCHLILFAHEIGLMSVVAARI